MQKIGIKFVITLVLLLYVALFPTIATGRPQKHHHESVDSHNDDHVSEKERVNAWTVSLAAGLVEGAPLHYAAEVARVLDDGDEFRVIPMITRGVTDNFRDLLYLQGVDCAIVHADFIESMRDNADIKRKINYIVSMSPAELHVLARPEIKYLEDLNGRVVNFNTVGTPAAYSGPIIFRALGVKPRNWFEPNSQAMEKMQKGEISAIVFMSSAPLDIFNKDEWHNGFHFLPLQYNYNKLGKNYLPSYLRSSDYPRLIPKGLDVPTIAVPVVLITIDGAKDSDRYRRMERFVQRLFAKWPELQARIPKLKNVNLAAELEGWRRFPAVEEELAKPENLSSLKQLRAMAVRAFPGSPAEQEEALRDYLIWRSLPRRQEDTNIIDEKELNREFQIWRNTYRSRVE